jgi:GNAT superfamily N-acetyltransferase
LLAEHRAAVWLEVGGWNVADLLPQVPIWAAFFREHLEDTTYVAFIVEEDGKAIGSGGLLIHLALPRPHHESDRAGRVQSVYVHPSARRRGVARAIMEHLLRYAREATLVSLTLHPSSDARHLYTALGFTTADEMLLHLTRD